MKSKPLSLKQKIKQMKKLITTINNPQTIKASLLIVFILTVNIFPAMAEPDPFDGPDLNDVPLDGGLSILLAAGVGYGAKKIKEKRQKQ